LFGGVPGKVLDIDKRLLLEKGSDFETLSELPKGLSICPSSSGLCPHFPPLPLSSPPAFYGPSPFLSPSPPLPYTRTPLRAILPPVLPDIVYGLSPPVCLDTLSSQPLRVLPTKLTTTHARRLCQTGRPGCPSTPCRPVHKRPRRQRQRRRR
jgi:hypothetical protein